MSPLLRRLTSAVAQHPAVTVALVLLLTVLTASFAPQGEIVNASAAFAPRTEQVLAQEELQDRFQDAATATVQVVVTGGPVISEGGVETVARIGAVAEDVFGPALASAAGRPAVVSYLQPVQGIACLTGTSLERLDDTSLASLYSMALRGGPPGGGQPAGAQPDPTSPECRATGLPAAAAGAGEGPDAGALAAALVGGDDPLTSTSGLVLVQLDRAAFEDEQDLIDTERAFVATMETADTPLRAIPFSFELIREPDESFQAEVLGLFRVAALIILAVLALVLRARRGARLGLGGAVRRSAADMGISMLTVMLAVGTTMGLLVLLGPSYVGLLNQPTPPTQIVPILLLALGVDYAIHAQTRYREELAKGAMPQEVVAGMGGHVGVALFLSMVTTGIGFLTNRFSPIPAIQDLGILAALGILVVFLYSVTFLPAVRLLLDRRAQARGVLVVEEVAPSEESVLSRVAAVGVRPALRAPVLVLGLAVVFAAGGAYGLTQMDTEFSITSFLPDDSPFLEAFEVLDEDFGGGLAEVTEVLVTGPQVLTTEHHNAIARVPERLAVDGVVQLGGAPDVTTPVTVFEGVLRSAAAALPDGAGADSLPEPLGAAIRAGLQVDGTIAPDGDVEEVYRLMAGAHPDAASVVDVDGETPAVRIAVRTQTDSVGVEVLSARVEHALVPITAVGSRTVAVNEALITDDILTSMEESQVRGLVLTVVTVMLLLGLVYLVRSRQPGLGVLVMLPVSVVVLWVFGAMWLAGIPFDPVTAVISSLVVGVGVDFCIHLGERYVEDLEAAGGDIDLALRTALRHTGAALAGSAATTTLGFSILAFSSILPFQRLGTVTIFAMVMSMLAVVFVLPPLLVLYGRRHGGSDGRDTQVVARSSVVQA